MTYLSDFLSFFNHMTPSSDTKLYHNVERSTSIQSSDFIVYCNIKSLENKRKRFDVYSSDENGKLIGYVKNITDMSLIETWRCYVIVPEIWYDDVKLHYSKKKPILMKVSDIRLLPRITYFNKKNDNYVIGWNSTSCGTLENEIRKSYNLCWSHIYYSIV
jgi:hypothetical protein